MSNIITACIGVAVCVTAADLGGMLGFVAACATIAAWANYAAGRRA